jgi:hypothetical protein
MQPGNLTAMHTQVEPPHESAEALLRSLDLEIALRRNRRGEGRKSRAAILVGGMVMLVGGAAVALIALFSNLRSFSESHGRAVPAESNLTQR